MRKIAGLSLLALLLFSLSEAQTPSYTKLKADAEREYAEKSYRRAHELYEQAAKLELPESERRWVTFRLADTAVREAMSSGTDAAAARAALEEFIAKSEHDEIWAAANETLAEHTRDARYFRHALDFWAGSSDLPRARRRYLDLVWKWVGDNNDIWSVPMDVLVNAVQIAETPEDRARARFILAQQYLSRGNAADRERALELLEEIVALGRKTDLYDDALYHLAANAQDYVRALKLYRRILREYQPNDSEFYAAAQEQIKAILDVNVNASVSGTFLPDSEQAVHLSWRNTKQIELTVRSVDLTRPTRFNYVHQWMEALPTDGPVVRRWTYDTNDTGEHLPGATELRIEPRLPVGAYVLTARTGTESSRQFLLVTDAHILVHAGREHIDVFVSDVETGEPIPNARVHLAQQLARDKVHHADGQTNADGLARIRRAEGEASMLVTAAAGARQAFHLTYAHYYGGRDTSPRWRIYAFTDRPAYRPGETVQWKMTARVREREQWTTPGGAQLDYFINSPRGEKLIKGEAKLNAFGSFWGEVPLTDAMPLGIYTIVFHTKGNETDLRGAAQLFRLEEYKLPEFVVKVDTPPGKQYRLGDEIEATIEASYYFGGPVANATVEAVVYQQPFHRYWYPSRHYHWYYDRPPMHGGGTIVHRQTLTTDAQGRAVVRINTPRDGSDSTYRIEARVVDASRREVRGEGTIRVMRHRYTVMAQPEHYVHRPGDSVSIDFKAVDANDKPVQVTGTVKVVRRQWKTRYVDEEVTTAKVSTNAEGEATFTFTPRETGYYAIQWRSEDGPRARDVITAETAVWVTDRATTNLGYHSSSGLDLILDKDTVRTGETASILVVTPAGGRHVVFSTGTDDLLDTQVLRMDGTVKLVQIAIGKQHMPNFHVTASTVFDRAFATDTEQIVVPPAEQFLDVEVKSDREEYQPREEGTVTITTRDASGKPVVAEVALAVSDEAVTAIQEDLAGDPRRTFYGETRANPIVVSAGVQTQQYVKLEKKDLEEQEKRERDEEGMAKLQRRFGDRAMDAVSESITATAANAPMPVPPPPPPAPASVSPPAEPVVGNVAGAQQGIEVQVRSDFRSTAFWKPDIVTDASGTATVKVKYPEALTTWRATARAATAGAEFGMASSTARTSMPLLVRLQGPRFFVAGDRVVVSAVMNNNTDETLTVNASLEATGVSGGQAIVPVQIPPHGEARADWTVVAEKPGEAKLRVTAKSNKHGDAMERSFIVYEHGIDKLIARSGKVRGDEANIKLELPRERRATDLTVQVAPSIAVTMLDALPYLIEFPYGCTEQTMSRFLPAAIVARTVEKLGLGRARIAGKDLDAVTAAGIARLYDMQHGNGAWGWWKEGPDDPWMTAYVVWGFSIARDAGLKIDTSRIDRAARWLETSLVRHQTAYNDQAWMLHALSAWKSTAAEPSRRAFENVYKNREKLTSYSRALLALTAHRWGEAERARLLLRNLEDGVTLENASDDTAESMQTAHWGAAHRFWWRWYESPVETTAFALQAFVTIDPEHKLVEPAMNWLVKNRRGTRWNNTRDTAIALLAMNVYLEKSGELLGDVSYEVTVNGRVIATKTLTAKDVLNAPSRFSVDPAILADATQEIRIRRTAGKSPLYFAAEARFVSLEEPVKAAGNELWVKRQYFRLAPRQTLLKGTQYDRVPLRDNESIASGERVEVLVTIETKNDYEYMLFEDLKPGGFEAVALQSGYSLSATSARASVPVYQELRDRKVAMFIDRLPQGTWEIRYELRAEVPGTFHALPLLGQAFYVPDVRANSDEIRVTVRE